MQQSVQPDTISSEQISLQNGNDEKAYGVSIDGKSFSISLNQKYRTILKWAVGAIASYYLIKCAVKSAKDEKS
jgi:hypothetical protein